MKKNKYFVILVLGVALWIGETAYFGFNAKPQSGVEQLLDTLSGGMILFGFIGDLLRNVRITKSYNNVTTHRINTKRVIVNGENPKVTTRQTFRMAPERHEQPKPTN